MYGSDHFEIAYKFLSKQYYHKAIPYLFEAAQEGHPLAHMWIENIYSHGLDAQQPARHNRPYLFNRAILPIL